MVWWLVGSFFFCILEMEGWSHQTFFGGWKHQPAVVVMMMIMMMMIMIPTSPHFSHVALDQSPWRPFLAYELPFWTSTQTFNRWETASGVYRAQRCHSQRLRKRECDRASFCAVLSFCRKSIMFGHPLGFLHVIMHIVQWMYVCIYIYIYIHHM